METVGELRVEPLYTVAAVDHIPHFNRDYPGSVVWRHRLSRTSSTRVKLLVQL